MNTNLLVTVTSLTPLSGMDRLFTKIAGRISSFAGQLIAFIVAFVLILLWGASVLSHGSVPDQQRPDGVGRPPEHDKILL